MTLIELIKTLQEIALTQVNVRTATNGDVYEVMNGNPSVKYGVFHITQNTHQSLDDYDIYGLNLFYIDRNEDDNANTLQIQSIGKSVIDNIIRLFCEEFDADIPTITFTPFTQRFDDDTAGVYAALQLEVYKDWNCADVIGGLVKPITLKNQTKEVKITESGVYTVTYDEGYTGLEKVIIDTVLADTIQDTKEVEITQNSVVSVLPDTPYESMAKVTVNVNIPVQEKSLEINQNEVEYEVVADEGYEYLEKVAVNVNIPVQEKKSITANNNGLTMVYPDDGYDYMQSVAVNFEYNPDVLPVIPSQINFKGSTMTEFDMGDYDWKYVYNWTSMFYECFSLQNIYNFPDNAVAYGSILYIFYNCNNLVELPYFNTEYVGNFDYAFAGCHNITELPQYNLRNALSIVNMSSNCGSLVTIPQLDCHKVVYADAAFASCPSLENVGGLTDIKCNISFSSSPKLTHQSLQNIINGLYDFNYWYETPDSFQGTLTLSSTSFALLTEEDITIATNKGWTITT